MSTPGDFCLRSGCPNLAHGMVFCSEACRDDESRPTRFVSMSAREQIAILTSALHFEPPAAEA